MKHTVVSGGLNFFLPSNAVVHVKRVMSIKIDLRSLQWNPTTHYGFMHECQHAYVKDKHLHVAAGFIGGKKHLLIQADNSPILITTEETANYHVFDDFFGPEWRNWLDA